MNPEVGQVAQSFMQLLIWLIVARAVVSLIPIGPLSPLFQIKEVIVGTTEPLVAPFRRFVPSSQLMDFTPIAAIVAIIFTKAILLSLTGPV